MQIFIEFIMNCIHTFIHTHILFHIISFYLHIILFKINRINESISEKKKDTKFYIGKNLDIILLAKIMRGNRLGGRCTKIETEK